VIIVQAPRADPAVAAAAAAAQAERERLELEAKMERKFQMAKKAEMVIIDLTYLTTNNFQICVWNGIGGK
jgi:hypothetical protein